MEALFAPLRLSGMKTEMIDSSCKWRIAGSKGLLSRIASNHVERSWHPQVHQPLSPSLNYAYEMTDIPGNFSKQPNSCHTHLSWAERAGASVRASAHKCESVFLFFFWLCASVCDSMCELRTYKSEKLMQRRQGMGSVSSPVTHVAQWALHRGWNLNICRSITSKNPQARHGSPRGRPKSGPCHLFCVSLTFCLSYVNVFSPRLPSTHTLSSSCPSILAAGEVTFINGKFICMTAPKPELCLDHPRRLSVNSCNHQSAKYLPFRAHQLWMRWPGVIYGIKSISSSADLHWYWYGVISSWLRLLRDRRT